MGAENVFMVSKASADVARKTIEWMKHRNFFTHTGTMGAVVCMEV